MIRYVGAIRKHMAMPARQNVMVLRYIKKESVSSEFDFGLLQVIM